MKIRIEADSPEELRAKSDAVLRKLAKALSASAPAVSDALEKAREKLPPKERPLKHRALQDGFDDIRALYLQTLTAMVDEIGAALEEHADALEKSEAGSPDYTTGIVSLEQAGYDRAKQQLALHGYSDADFAEGGRLYGLTTNDLRELISSFQKAG